MFNWWKGAKDDASAAPQPAFDLDEVARLDQAILFKHSNSCPTSWMAQAEVKRFAQKNPDVPVFTVVVQENRPLSNRIAEWTGIQHQSPQVIILRRGAVVASESHEGVTVDFLTESSTPK